jgi:SAM-dependent methyltransferase
MEFFELKNISERFINLINPSSPEKMIRIGEILRLHPESQVIDFGCGFGEVLALWGEHFGISGLGIDIREHACQRAHQRIAMANLDERIEIICANGANYSFEKNVYDVAVCTGASFIWDKFGDALIALSTAVHKGGKIVIGEPHWLSDETPPVYRQRMEEVHSEYELLQRIHEEGMELEYLVRASHDDWDRYEADNRNGLVRWIEENPHHLEQDSVVEHLRQSQEEYLQYGRQYLGWAIYVLGFAHSV